MTEQEQLKLEQSLCDRMIELRWVHEREGTLQSFLNWLQAWWDFSKEYKKGGNS